MQAGAAAKEGSRGEQSSHGIVAKLSHGVVSFAFEKKKKSGSRSSAVRRRRREFGTHVTHLHRASYIIVVAPFANIPSSRARVDVDGGLFKTSRLSSRKTASCRRARVPLHRQRERRRETAAGGEMGKNENPQDFLVVIFFLCSGAWRMAHPPTSVGARA